MIAKYLEDRLSQRSYPSSSALPASGENASSRRCALHCCPESDEGYDEHGAPSIDTRTAISGKVYSQ